MSVVINGHSLTVDEIVKVARFKEDVVLSEEAIVAINKSRKVIDELLSLGKAVYGVNTGFGKLSDKSIKAEQLKKLQENLIISHAVGTGDDFNIETVRAMLVLRINSLANGHSGIRIEVINKLIELLNKDVIPAVPSKGSLGASGDLAPLAHMVLPILGKGYCYINNEKMTSIEAFELKDISFIELEAKEGLALINGTQAMLAVGVLCIYDAKKLLDVLDVTASLSMEALNGIIDAFDERVQALRPHKGQITVAKNVLKLLKNSSMITKQGQLRVQDGYSLRCIPQIHGASRDAIDYCFSVITTEINSVTDNPLIFEEEMEAISGGNFHGQPLAITFDFLGIAIAEMANVSESRIERLVNPALSNLPAFLIKNGGVNSGYMIVQYSAAALVSENKVLAHPASVDSISSSAGQEDHVSMGTIAARKAREIFNNTRRVIAMELMCACQGIDLNMKFDVKQLGVGTDLIYKLIRKDIPMVEFDREFFEEINYIEGLIKNEKINKLIEGILR